MVARRRRSTDQRTDRKQTGPVKKIHKLKSQFHGYRLVRDESWLGKGQTWEQATRCMEHSFSSTDHISEIPCIWADDLKAEFRRENGHRKLLAPTGKDRTCNSFLQYRILVQRCFTGQQTDISKVVETLWRRESKEMYFYCFRNAEIETCIRTRRKSAKSRLES